MLNVTDYLVGRRNTKLKLRNGTSAVLQLLIHQFGGTGVALAEYINKKNPLCNVKPHQIINWRNTGAVPAKYVPYLQKIFRIDPYLLNYKVATIQNNATKSWKTVVKNSGFSGREQRIILACPAPTFTLEG
jgi:hypothetical protein